VPNHARDAQSYPKGEANDNSFPNGNLNTGEKNKKLVISLPYSCPITMHPANRRGVAPNHLTER